jgi:putative transposase
MGLLLAVVVHAANVQDRDGAKLLFMKVKGCFPRLKLIWADGAYAGQLIQWVGTTCQWILEIVKRCDKTVGFHVLPRRWVVERTFDWLGRYRRLSKDYEYLTDTSETMIQISMIQLMLRRLTRTAAAPGPC